MTLGTVMPTPADVVLNSDDEGQTSVMKMKKPNKENSKSQLLDHQSWL
jgi:hypothetical protein